LPVWFIHHWKIGKIYCNLNTTTDRKERQQLEDQGNAGEGSYNFGGRTDQRVHSLMFTVMIIILILHVTSSRLEFYTKHPC
jgi:hypothetical protein